MAPAGAAVWGADPFAFGFGAAAGCGGGGVSTAAGSGALGAGGGAAALGGSLAGSAGFGCFRMLDPASSGCFRMLGPALFSGWGGLRISVSAALAAGSLRMLGAGVAEGVDGGAPLVSAWSPVAGRGATAGSPCGAAATLRAAAVSSPLPPLGGLSAGPGDGGVGAAALGGGFPTLTDG